MTHHRITGPGLTPGSLLAGIVLCLLLTLPASAGLEGGADSVPGGSMVSPGFADLTVFFVPNEGQMDPDLLFHCNGPGYTLYLTRDRVVSSIPVSGGRVAISGYLPGSNPAPGVEGLDPLATRVSFFSGREADWRTGIIPFSGVRYREIYPGIDMILRAESGGVTREFFISPGADPGQIRMTFEGADEVRVREDGALLIRAGQGGIQEAAPVCYQELGGRRWTVPCRFAVREGDMSVSFSIGRYDPTLPLVIDPPFAYCGYLGGRGDDTGMDIAVDREGNTYLVGTAWSAAESFPEVTGPDLTLNGGGDVFVAKVNAAGNALVYCGYIGGSDADSGEGIAVDSEGNAYVTGYTNSTQAAGFPVTAGSLDATHNGGGQDAFVAKVNPAGTALTYCGYIGGNAVDRGMDIAVGGDGSAYLTGDTISDPASFPETGGSSLTRGGYYDVFVAKVNPSGTSLTYCGYIGGTADDHGEGIAVDGTGNAYVTGFTYCSPLYNFPVTIGPGLVYKGYWDAFVAKVNAAGTGLDYCGYIAGSESDEGKSIAVDNLGNAYVTGTTSSGEDTFPVTAGPDLFFNQFVPGSDAFVAKVNPGGTGLVYCGYIGGSGSDIGSGIAVDGAGNAFVTGRTSSDQSSFPVKAGPDLTYSGGADAFVAKMTPGGSALTYCGYIGGSAFDAGNAIAVDQDGAAYVAGETRSPTTTFPVAAGPDLSYNGGDDAFVAKVCVEYGRGVFRPSAWNNWILDRWLDGKADVRDHYGLSTDIPILVDLDDDSGMDRVLFRAGDWVVDYGIDGNTDDRDHFGMAGDLPLVGRMGADGITDRAVFRAGEWIIDYSADGSVNARNMYGMEGDLPLIGDFNNDGNPDRAVFRPSAWENWIISYGMIGGVDFRDHFGSAGDIPVVGDFNLDGVTDRAVFRAGEWIMDFGMDGSVNSRVRYGQAGDIPLVWRV